MKKFCRKCGKEMTQWHIIAGYNLNNGEPVKEILWKCPSYIPIISFFGGHDKIYSDIGGELSFTIWDD